MTTRITRTLLALILGAILVVASGPAGAAVSAADPAVPITSTTTLAATGHGFGHGNGMSQYGARGAAANGLTYPQILAFYYPGTSWSALTATVRVLITGDTDNNTTVRSTRGLRLKDYGNGKVYWLPTTKKPRAWRLKTVYNKTRVYYLTGSWHLYRTGGRTALAGTGEFRSSTGLITLRLPAGDRTYRGALRYVNRDTVNVLSMENYLKGVVPSEVPASWPTEAVRAQAVAARTYAARQRADDLTRYYQICDTAACQVYKGYTGEQAASNAAVTATAGKILVYGGQPAFTQFSASSGGWTSSGSQPYLISKQDIYDTPAVDPYYNWTKPIDMTKLRAAYGAGTLMSIDITQREGTGDWGGRVESIVLDGSAGPKALTGDQFRLLAGLRSTYFTLSSP